MADLQVREREALQNTSGGTVQDIELVAIKACKATERVEKV